MKKLHFSPRLVMTMIVAVSGSVHAQQDMEKPTNSPSVRPSLNYQRAIKKAEAGDRQSIREAAVLIDLQSPLGDYDLTKDSWVLTPKIAARMNSMKIERAVAILADEANIDFESEKGEGGTALEVCVWKTRRLKLRGDDEIDDRTNFRLTPKATVSTRLYKSGEEPCLEGEHLGPCGRNNGIQAERDEIYAKLNETDRKACVQRGVYWHLVPQ